LIDLDIALSAQAAFDSTTAEPAEIWQEQSQQRLDAATFIATEIVQRFKRQGIDGFTLADQSLTSATHLNDNELVIINARDDATTSANSLAAQFFAKLYRASGDLRHKQIAQGLLDTFSMRLSKAPAAMSGMLVAKMILDYGEIDNIQTFAKSHGYLKTQTSAQSVTLSFALDQGWHINADQVLNEYLIPTNIEIPDDSDCPQPSIRYPSPKIVKLGFQAEPLSVFEGQFKISLKWPEQSEQCAWFAANIYLQACSNAVCLQPEGLPIRAVLK
jgi:hypothetical protein